MNIWIGFFGIQSSSGLLRKRLFSGMHKILSISKRQKKITYVIKSEIQSEIRQEDHS